MLRECRMQKAECSTPSPTLPPGGGGKGWGGIRKPQSKGFTLIEVILVTVIIGILAATVMPRFDFTTTTTASVDGAAYIVASDIRYAQEFAMANRISKTITFNSGSSVYTFGPPSNMDPSGRLPEGARVSTTITITFNSLGEPIAGGGGSVTVEDLGSTQSKTITVENYTGKASFP
jgi:prepilin-type N-terminal cleavage/methylation domain-containing protein